MDHQTASSPVQQAPCCSDLGNPHWSQSKPQSVLWSAQNEGWWYQIIARKALILASRTLNCCTHFQVLAPSTALNTSYPVTQKSHSWGCASLRSVLTSSEGQNAHKSKKLGTACRFSSSGCDVWIVVCLYNEVIYSKGWCDKLLEHTGNKSIISTLREKKCETIRSFYWFLYRKFQMPE